MNDLFFAAANRAEKRQRDAEAPGKSGLTIENNALTEIVKERKRQAEKAEAEKKLRESRDLAEFQIMLDATRDFLGKIGRPVESFYINDGNRVIVAHRKGESVRIPIQGIHDAALRRIACAKIIEAVAGY